MSQPNDLVKKLRTDAKYKEALGKARSGAERKAITQLVETFVGAIGDVLGPAIARAKSDPSFARQLAMALKTGIVTTEPEITGSIKTDA